MLFVAIIIAVLYLYIDKDGYKHRKVVEIPTNYSQIVNDSYNILIESINQIYVNSFNSNDYSLCCTDINTTELYKKNMIDIDEINNRLYNKYNYKVKNLKIYVKRCFYPNADVLCIRFTEFT